MIQSVCSCVLAQQKCVILKFTWNHKSVLSALKGYCCINSWRYSEGIPLFLGCCFGLSWTKFSFQQQQLLLHFLKWRARLSKYIQQNHKSEQTHRSFQGHSSHTILIQAQVPGQGTGSLTYIWTPVGTRSKRLITVVTKVHRSSTNHESCLKLNFITNSSLVK